MFVLCNNPFCLAGCVRANAEVNPPMAGTITTTFEVPMSIWFKPFSLDHVQQAFLNAADLAAHLDIKITEVGPDYLRGTMPVDDRTRQPFGLLHGGASVALAETLGSVASNYCVDTSRFYCVGQEINANHLRSVRAGRVTGTARPIHLGSRSHVWDIRIEDEAGRMTCISRLTMSVLEARGGVAERMAGRPQP
jgi:1,4-dihydroxy-2-naphthoyl-CoA hydrolase